MLPSGAVASHLTRRAFTASLTLAAASRFLRAQTKSLAHLNVATLEGDRILAAAGAALKQPVTPITTVPSPLKDKQAFYSELNPDPVPDTTPKPAFRDHATALRQFSSIVAELTAAFLITHDNQYALRAGQHLYAWLVDPSTRLSPTFANAGYDATKSTGTPAGLIDAAPLAEAVLCTIFLVDTAALSPPDTAAAHAWLTALLTWLNTDPIALIARDHKDHTASAHLLLSATIARALHDEHNLEAVRHRFRTPTLRNQINSVGFFPHEAATAFPFRNTMLNLDLLSATAQVLTTPFDSLWQYELQDGPGMRSVIAALYPVLKDPGKWPFVADPQYFRSLPGRRPALLFAGRAFDRPDYIALWQSTPPPTNPPEPIAASFPVTQPLLWTTPAPHGL